MAALGAVLDASALVALLEAEPGGAEVAGLMGAGATMSAVNLAEARDRLLRRAPDRSRASSLVAEVVARGLSVLPIDLGASMDASDLRAAHYDRNTCAVSLADCFAVVAAQQASGILVSSDGVLCRLAVSVGVQVHPIANSAGVRPEL